MRAAIFAFSVLLIASAAVARDASTRVSRDELAIRAILDHWKHAAENKDVDGVMSIYLPGSTLVAYDIVPPLAYRGTSDYRNDYKTFFAQYKGPLSIEYRDLHVVAGGTVAFSYGLEKIAGSLTDGTHSDTWIRFTEGYQKVHGRWYAIHDHASVPADMNSGKALLNLTP